jgi:polysaccharide export outer membrane protein
MKKIFSVLLMMTIVACSSVPQVANVGPQPNDSKKLLVDVYEIGVDDRVQVNVWKHPDLSITVPVRPDGMISVPLIGEVLAGGRTPVDVADDIQKRLEKFIKQPNVAVILFELNSHEYLSRVRVTGAVRSPLSITYRQGMTVLDVVLEAGGLNEFASGNSAKLFRRSDGKSQSLDVDVDDIFNDGDMSTNYAMEPGDILSVPERIF